MTAKLSPAALLLAFAATCAAAPAQATPEPAKSRAAASRLAKIAAHAKVRQVLVVRSGRHGLRYASAIRIEPAKPSFGQMIGLHESADSLELKSGVALVLDQDTNEVLFSKNSQAILPIASLTKLMTAMVVTESHQPLDETITITDEDIDTEKGSRSRLRIGTQLRREEMLHLALMASENRAAHALGRSYPGGLGRVRRGDEPEGARPRHERHPLRRADGPVERATSRAPATWRRSSRPRTRCQLIRELSTSPEYMVEVGNRAVQFRNTNGLVKSPEWDIGLQKTGYISEAGRCLVMQAKMAGRHLIMVFLDSAGKYSRIGDAERVRRWITASVPGVVPAALDAHKPTL